MVKFSELEEQLPKITENQSYILKICIKAKKNAIWKPKNYLSFILNPKTRFENQKTSLSGDGLLPQEEYR